MKLVLGVLDSEQDLNVASMAEINFWDDLPGRCKNGGNVKTLNLGGGAAAVLVYQRRVPITSPKLILSALGRQCDAAGRGADFGGRPQGEPPLRSGGIPKPLAILMLH